MVAVRGALTTALELVGLGAVTAGAAVLNPAAGLITGGVLAVTLGVVTDLAGRRRGEKGGPR